MTQKFMPLVIYIFRTFSMSTARNPVYPKHKLESAQKEQIAQENGTFADNSLLVSPMTANVNHISEVTLK